MLEQRQSPAEQYAFQSEFIEVLRSPRQLATRYVTEGELEWALRFAELCTWVYQRAADHAA